MVILKGIKIGKIFKMLVVKMLYNLIEKKDVEGGYVKKQEEGSEYEKVKNK